MFEKGEYVVYGSTGICRVCDITTMDMAQIPKDRLYYLLEPWEQAGNRIFTPVDNPKMKLRKILSHDDAMELIDNIQQIEELWIGDEKLREQKYKECLRSCECREWIRIIKALYLRRKERISLGKKITSTDERYLKMAEDFLYTELSISLKLPKEGMEKYIVQELGPEPDEALV